MEIFILSMNNGFKTQFHCTLLFKLGSERPFFHPQHFLITGLLQISWLFAKLPLTSELNFQQRISSALSVSGHKYPLSSLYFLHLFPDSTFAPLRMSRLPWWWNQGSAPNLNPSLNYLKLPQTAPPRSCYSHISRHVLAPSWKYLMRFGMGTVQISPTLAFAFVFGYNWSNQKSKSKWREKSYEWCDDWSPQNSSGSDTYITVCFTLCPTELNLILYICSNTCITCCCCFSRLRHWGHENHRCIIRCLRPPLLNGHRFREPSHRSIFYLFEWRPGVFPSSEN